MNRQEELSNYLRDISYRLGVGLPALDQNGVCAMRYDDKFNVILEVPDASDDIYMYAILMSQHTASVQFYQKLLEANFLCMDTERATFCLDKESNDIVLCRTIEFENLTADKLEKVINQFLSAADKWNNKLIEIEHSAANKNVIPQSAQDNKSGGQNKNQKKEKDKQDNQKKDLPPSQFTMMA
ncbi:MAG: type III secretion system chaperone [Desulfobacteraceae bacterium]|nr:type III secretion system chaperone [Desulfobacteraceae bacterium]